MANADPALDLVDADAFWAEPGQPADIMDAEMGEAGDAQLVADLIAECPHVVADRLRREVDAVRAEGFADDVIADGLRKWCGRPDAKPGLLPYLVADVVKERNASPWLDTGGIRPGSPTAKAMEWNAIAERGVARTAAQSAALSPRRRPVWRCNKCHDRGLVLNNDGDVGSDPRICHHDGSWHIASEDELAELERRRRLA